MKGGAIEFMNNLGLIFTIVDLLDSAAVAEVVRTLSTTILVSARFPQQLGSQNGNMAANRLISFGL